MKQKLRVLVAEGNSREAASTLLALFPKEKDSLELTEVSGVPTLMASLELVRPEVILLELALAEPDPLYAVRRLHRTEPAVPLIVIGDATQREALAGCLKIGALDYLLKGRMDAPTMNRVLSNAMRRNTLEGLTDLLRDPLTGLFVRDGFLTMGAHMMEAAKVNEGDLVLLCAQIEALEEMRDNFGQSVVDRSLKEIGKLLTGSFRRTDVVGRIGESQFAALAVDAVEPSVPVLLQRLAKHLAALNQELGPPGPLLLRMNAGFWSAKDTRSFVELLDSVEVGLRGAGCVVEKSDTQARAIV